MKFPSESISPLVANITCTRLYDVRYGWGRLWCWFYKITERITHKSYRLETLQKTVHYTHQIFLEEIVRVQLGFKDYLDYLKKNGKGYSLEETLYFNSRKMITQWNQSTKPFLKLIQKSFIQNTVFNKFNLDLISSSDLSGINTIQSCQRILDLEGIIGGPLPLIALKKIIRQIPLNLLDQKDLTQFLYHIEKQNLDVKPLHEALKFLVQIYLKKKMDSQEYSTALVNLELFLENKGCLIFQKNDLKHLRWRQQLEPGTRFSFKDFQITLGEEIFPKKIGSDQTRAYKVQQKEHHIAIIAQNKAILELKNFRMQQENYPGIEPLLIQEITPDGRVGLLENLRALDTIKWVTSQDRQSEENELLINILAKLIQEFIKKKWTPSNLSPTYLMFNGKFQLKLLKSSQKGLFDFNAIEDFIFECASNHPIIFKKLMVQSELINHPVAQFYRDSVKNVLNCDHTDMEDLAGIYKIADPKVIDRATSLIKQILIIKNEWKLKLRENFSKLSVNEIENKVNDMILEKYLQSKTAGILWPQFEQI